MSSTRILAVDDEQHILTLIQRSLEPAGFEVLTADSGERCLKSVKRQPPDAIILDLVLPGITGNEVCAILRKDPATSKIPILMITGRASDDDVVHGFELGADDYVAKPFSPKLLLAKLQTMLRHAGRAQQPPDAAPTPPPPPEPQKYEPLIKKKPQVREEPNLADHFQILETLGKGKDSVVYRALDLKAKPPTEVALKLFEFKEDDANFVAKFLREVQGLSKLSHPNIVKFLSYGSYQDDYFIVTEYIKGQTLGAAIKKIGPIAEESAITLALEIAKAFKYYDQFGIVHRDVKPDNIIISDDGQVVLVDFGLAKAQNMQTLSMKDEVAGTPQFLAPEYISGGAQIDIKTDIYSLGITIFYAVSGTLPFQARTAMALIHQQLTQEAPSLAQVLPSVSPGLSNLVDTMLVKDPADRCDLDELIASLEALQK